MNAFELAKKRRDELKNREESKKNRQFTPNNFEHIEYLSIKGEEKVFRIIGNPYILRENNYDMKLIHWSKVLKDDNKSFMNVIWKSLEDEPEQVDTTWILYRLYTSVMDRYWEKYSNGELRNGKNGEWRYKNEGRISYDRINFNKRNNDRFSSSFFPRSRAILNVIDRHDNWCKENKHTKILTSNLNYFTYENNNKEKNTIYYPEYGIPFSVYDLIYNKVVDFRGNWNLDIIIKLNEKDYDVKDILEEKISPKVRELGNDKPLTLDEKNYEKYNLDELFKVTSYYKLKYNLEKLFKQTDLDLNTNFYEELCDLVSSEEKNKNIKQKHIKNSINFEEHFPSWSEIKESDRIELENSIESINGETINYKNNIITIPCSCDKKILFPETVWNCPLCANSFDTLV